MTQPTPSLRLPRAPYRYFLIASISAAVLPASSFAQLDTEPQALLPDLRYSSPVDLDGDGRDEIVGVSHVSNALVAYSVQDDGSVVFRQRLASAGSESVFTINRWHLQLADLDGDGLGDLVGQDATNLRVFYGRQDGTFDESVAIDLVTSMTGLAPMDLDTDGDLDLVLFPPSTNVGGPASSTIDWIENLGAGAFASRMPLITGVDDYAALDPIDVDGDGDIDLVGFRSQDRFPVIVRNLGTSLQAESIPSALPRAFASQPGDVDGDGDVDLLVLRAGPNGPFSSEIDLYRNDSGSFQPPTVVLVEPDGFRFDMALANVDGAGANELIAIVTEPGTRVSIRVYPFTSQGVYEAAVDEIDVSQQQSFRDTLTVGRFDGDSRDDLFLRWLELASPGVRERLSPRIFSGEIVAGLAAFAEPALLAQRSTQPFLSADLDGDEVADLIQRQGDVLEWRRGIPGSVRVGGAETIPVDGKLELLEDFNGDGQPEILLSR
ncbi:MAG: FG-GAP-like repeat-containing protein [Planctomycetota bacterium]